MKKQIRKIAEVKGKNVQEIGNKEISCGKKKERRTE